MAVIEIFPTYIQHQSLNITDEEIKELKQFVYDLRDKQKNYKHHFLTPNSFSSYDTNRELHKLPIFRKLSTTFLKAATDLANETIKRSNKKKEYEIKDHYAAITAMWANIYKKGGRVLEHIHHGSTFAGIFYLQQNEKTGQTYFVDPLEYHKMIDVGIMNQNENHYQIAPTKTKDLVIWPAYMKHGAIPNDSDDEKVIISYNINFFSKVNNL